MGYKLEDGSDSDLYRVGDTFLSGKHSGTLIEIGEEPLIDFGFSGEAAIFSEQHVDWRCLKPTEETKRKVVERNQPKCKCGYVIPVMEITGGDSGSLENMLSSVFNLGDKKPQDVAEVKFDMEMPSGTYQTKTVVNIHVPEPLARIIDWRGGEEVKPLDFVVSNEFGVDYRAVVLEVVSPTQIRTCRGLIGASHANLTIIRINTAVIPKQRTMTKAEAEREFGIKISD